MKSSMRLPARTCGLPLSIIHKEVNRRRELGKGLFSLCFSPVHYDIAAACKTRVNSYSAPIPRYSRTFSPAKLSKALFSGVRSDTRNATRNDAAIE
jgi:hypothetical protein